MNEEQPTTADLVYHTWQLALDAGSVIWMRSWLMLGGGDRAAREGHRMVDEKVAAALTLWPALVEDGLPASPEALGMRALAHYSRPVRANRRRLSGQG